MQGSWRNYNKLRTRNKRRSGTKISSSHRHNPSRQIVWLAQNGNSGGQFHSSHSRATRPNANRRLIETSEAVASESVASTAMRPHDLKVDGPFRPPFALSRIMML